MNGVIWLQNLKWRGLECIKKLEAREPDHENVQENVPEYTNQANVATETRAIREPPAFDPTLLRQMYQNLNQKQACVFYAVRDWCVKRVCGLNPVFLLRQWRCRNRKVPSH